MKGRFVKLLFLLLFMFSFVDISFSYSVNAGEDQTVSQNEEVTLNGEKSGFESCEDISYYWHVIDGPKEFEIDPDYELTGAMISSDQTDTTGTYTIKLEVDGQYCGPDNEDEYHEEDTLDLTIEGGTSESPTDISLSKTDIDENVDTGSTVGTLSTTDSDSTSFTYDFVDYGDYPDNEAFKIDGGKLYINESPNYERQNSYTIKIQTTDESGNTFSKEFTIAVNDIDESTPSVDAGDDQTVIIGNTVNLVGTLNGFPSTGCDFKYGWGDDSGKVNIDNDDTIDQANFSTDDFTGDSYLKINLEVKVTSSDRTHDSCGKTGTYDDTVTIHIIKSSSGGGHHRSHYARMRDEANKIDLSKVKMKLYEYNKRNKYFYKLGWNYIGGDGHIKYEIQYSTGKGFKDFKSVKIISRYKIYSVYELGNNDIFFFRVRATYKGKYTSWSNIVSIVNKQSILSKFKITCINCANYISFPYVLNNIENLIDEKLDLTCQTCKNNISYFDVFDDEYSLLDKWYKTKCFGKKVRFNDIFEERNYLLDKNLKIGCSSDKNQIKKKISFDDLVK